MTLTMMARWGVQVEHAEADRYVVRAGQRYQARVYEVPPDASGASYFLAAAAVTGGTVRVRNLGLAVEQGDLGFVDVLEHMGCVVRRDGADVEVTGAGSAARDRSRSERAIRLDHDPGRYRPLRGRPGDYP